MIISIITAHNARPRRHMPIIFNTKNGGALDAGTFIRASIVELSPVSGYPAVEASNHDIKSSRLESLLSGLGPTRVNYLCFIRKNLTYFILEKTISFRWIKYEQLVNDMFTSSPVNANVWFMIMNHNDHEPNHGIPVY